jgi:hypothetical protein
MPLVALLGPQRLRPVLGEVVESLGLEGTVAAITSGWEERELEDQELTKRLGRPTENLRLHHRFEQVLAEEPDLVDAIHGHVDRLKRIRELYRLRLEHTMVAARKLIAREGADDDLHRARAAAVDAVRSLDDDHGSAVRRARRELAERCRWPDRPAVARHRKEIEGIVADCGAIAIAGGHVGHLLDHLRMFGIIEFLVQRPVIAWSAGAMVLTGRVVLFHDSPPQGQDDAEVHDEGLGLASGVIALPHARRRLRLDEPARIALLAQRFSPDACCAMDEGARIVLEDGRLREHANVRRLAPDGAVAELTSVEGATA